MISIVAVVAFCAVVAPDVGWAADGTFPRKTVLLLYAESRIMPAVVRVDEAARSRFQEAGVEADFFTEYLDLSWATDPRYEDYLRPFFLVKHRGRTFDVIIAVGAEALRFAVDNRADLFPGAPIVFCLVTPAGVRDVHLAPDVTGVWMTIDAAATLETAHRLQPHARRAVVVAGASKLDHVFLEDARRDLAARPLRLDLSYLVGLPLEGLAEQLAQLPRETIVLFLTIVRDGDGHTFSAAQAVAELAPRSSAPIYGISETYLDRGIVGGRVISIDRHGTRAADMAIRILAGESVARIAIADGPDNVDMFDWRQLRRWNLPERDLPRGALVLNRTPSLWEAYHWQIVVAAALIGTEALLIGTLMLQHRRRRRAEMAVEERLGFETLVSDLSATLVGLLGVQIDEGIEQGLRRVAEHLGLDRGLIVEFNPEDQAIRLTHAWNAPGVPPPESSVDFELFPWSVEQMRRGEVVRFSTLDELPETAAVDRQTLVGMGVTSAVGIPLVAAATTMGVLVLVSLHREREWPDDLVHRLRFIAGIFSSALLRQRGEVELRKLRRDLTHVGRVATMGELTASIAHELNQPLTAILTNAQAAERLIDGGSDAKEVREIVSDIVADDKRASEVIRRLRAFVKKDETNHSSLDMNAVVHDVVSLVRSDAIIRGVSIDLELSPTLPPVLADRVQLQQVVLNLIMNGLDAMRASPDRRLVMRTWAAGDGVARIAVSDRGPGIAETDLPRLFEPFYTTKPHGLGMGLSIARSLVEAHGGRLWVVNNPSGGATFTFTLPLASRAAA